MTKCCHSSTTDSYKAQVLYYRRQRMTSQALEILNFEQQLQVQDDSFKELSVLDKDGNIID